MMFVAFNGKYCVASEKSKLSIGAGTRDLHGTLLGAALAVLGMLTLSGCERHALDEKMNELCKVDGGVKVYETVTLPSASFDRYGMPLATYWRDPSLVGTARRLGPGYRYISRDELIKQGDPLKGQGRLTRYVEEVYRVSDGKLLGRSVTYGRAGGDLIVLEHFSTATCPPVAQPFLASIFIKGE